jgi:hypothetical protein
MSRWKKIEKVSIWMLLEKACSARLEAKKV